MTLAEEGNVDGFAYGGNGTVAFGHADQTHAITEDSTETIGIDIECNVVESAEKVVEEQERGIRDSSILEIDSCGTTGRCYILEKRMIVLVTTYTRRGLG